MLRLTAVSYTHLDVYKRQVHAGIGRKCEEVIKLLCFFNAGFSGITRSSAWDLHSSKSCENAVDLSPAHETARVEATGIAGC